jgi:aminoglycoside 3-N-acetyltransferase I
MNIRIEKLTGNDINKFTGLIRLFEEVFEMKNFIIPEEKYVAQLLSKENFFVFVAIADNNVVGGLTAYALQQYYAVSPLAYIYDLAVTTSFQRQGIGKLLIASLTSYCKDNGFEEVFVQADKVDEYALEFYRSTGGREEQVVHFSYLLNK